MIATLDDIATTLLRPTPAADSVDGKAWTMWAKDAERQIEARLGPISGLTIATVQYVIREAVAMKVKRPDPAIKVDVAVDDGSVSRTYEKSAGQVMILDDWWLMLAPATEVVRQAFTINPFGNRRR